jgi:hypothetical protein
MRRPGRKMPRPMPQCLRDTQGCSHIGCSGAHRTECAQTRGHRKAPGCNGVRRNRRSLRAAAGWQAAGGAWRFRAGPWASPAHCSPRTGAGVVHQGKLALIPNPNQTHKNDRGVGGDLPDLNDTQARCLCHFSQPPTSTCNPLTSDFAGQFCTPHPRHLKRIGLCLQVSPPRHPTPTDRHRLRPRHPL